MLIKMTTVKILYLNYRPHQLSNHGVRIAILQNPSHRRRITNHIRKIRNKKNNIVVGFFIIVVVLGPQTNG